MAAGLEGCARATLEPPPLPEHHAFAITIGILMQRPMPLRVPRRLTAMGWLLAAAGIVANTIAVHERGGEIWNSLSGSPPEGCTA